MDKTFIKFLILLFFLYIICQEYSIEPYIQINIRNTQTACDSSSESCMVSYRGDLGFHCTEPSDSDKRGYNIVDHDSNALLSDSFNVEVDGCSPGYEETRGPGTATANVCSSTNTPYTLTGCQPKCHSPSLSDTPVDSVNAEARLFADYPNYMSENGIHPDDFGNNDLTLEYSWIPVVNQGVRQHGSKVKDGSDGTRYYKLMNHNIKCSPGSSPVPITDNVCYDLDDNGRIVYNTDCRRSDQNNYLSYPGGLSYSIGVNRAEPTAILTADRPLNTGIGNDTLGQITRYRETPSWGDTLFDYSKIDPDITLQEDEPAKERQVMAYCPEPGAEYILFGCEPNCNKREESVPYPSIETIFKKNIDSGQMEEVETDPYHEELDSSLNPNNFNPNIMCSENYISNNPISGGSNRIPATQPGPCLHLDGHLDYVPSSCFPECSEGEECVNLTFNLNKSDYSWLNQSDKQVEVDGYKNNIPEFFQNSIRNSTPEKLNELKNSLYYYRSFSPDGNPDNEIRTIETQFRCTSGTEADSSESNQVICELLN